MHLEIRGKWLIISVQAHLQTQSVADVELYPQKKQQLLYHRGLNAVELQQRQHNDPAVDRHEVQLYLVPRNVLPW